MDWKEITGDIAKTAPILGGVVGGPVGSAVGSAIAAVLGVANTPDAVQQALQTNPDAAVKLATLENSYKLAQVAAQTAVVNAAAQQVDAVNKTLQTEAMSGSWWQRNHHAYECSFTLLMVAGIYILLPIAKIPVPLVDPMVWMMIGGILGVTAWQRGATNKIVAQQ